MQEQNSVKQKKEKQEQINETQKKFEKKNQQNFSEDGLGEACRELSW